MTKIFQSIFELISSDKYFKFVLPVILLFAAVITFKLIKYTHINGDVGYYLLCARDIAHGHMPYADFKLLYPPVAVSVFSLPFLFFGDVPDLSFFLGIQYLFVAACSLVSYLFIKSQTKCSTFAGMIALVVFLYILQLEGKFIVLEPITLLFGLLSIWFISMDRPYSIFVSGAFLSLAFLSKQYGLGFTVPCAVSLIIGKKNIVKKGLLLFSGFALPMVTFAGICMLGFGLSYIDFFNIFWNNDYGIRTIPAFATKLGVFFLTNALFLVPSLLLLLAIYYHQTKHKRMGAFSRLEITLLLSGIFMISTYFFPPMAFHHYAIFIIPFLILSLALYFFRMAAIDATGKYYTVIFFLFLLVSIYPIAHWTINGMDPAYRSQQIAEGKSLSAVVPAGSKVAILTGELEKYRFLCLWPSPLPKTVGYDWYYMITTRLKRDLVDHSDFVLAREQDTIMLRDLDGQPFKQIKNINSILIFQRTD